MKKLFVFAAAAVVALASCTKTVVNETPDRAISFQVANYVPQTKAGEVKYDGTSFHTYAWFHPDATATAQVFMNNEEIKLQDNTPATWAADRPYFWPKTGNINFFSYAGTPVPAVTENQALYSEKTIAVTDDALLASAAYHYGVAQAGLNTYSGLKYGTADTDVTGVPTLFHHILAKVSFKVFFSAEGIKDTNYKWDLVVNSASVEYANVGTLTVNFTDPGFTTTAQAWPYAAGTYNWVPKDGATNNVQAAPCGTNAVAFDGTANKQTVVANSAGDAKSDGIIILDEITVMPQVLATSAAKFRINYTLTSYYNNGTSFDQHIQETVNLSDTGTNPLGAILLTAFSSNAIPQWNMNYKYTYNVTIKPDKTVTFDPAVEAWLTDSTNYTYPND